MKAILKCGNAEEFSGSYYPLSTSSVDSNLEHMLILLGFRQH
jgi:hypothetical protein